MPTSLSQVMPNEGTFTPEPKAYKVIVAIKEKCMGPHIFHLVSEKFNIIIILIEPIIN